MPVWVKVVERPEENVGSPDFDENRKFVARNELPSVTNLMTLDLNYTFSW